MLQDITRYIPYLIPIILIQLVLLVICLADLFRREKVKGPKWAWALVVVFIQFIGPILYLVLGREEA